jgi:hypothetical protein
MEATTRRQDMMKGLTDDDRLRFIGQEMIEAGFAKFVRDRAQHGYSPFGPDSAPVELDDARGAALEALALKHAPQVDRPVYRDVIAEDDEFLRQFAEYDARVMARKLGRSQEHA